MLVLLLICAAWIVPAAAGELYIEVATSDELSNAIIKSTHGSDVKIVITEDFPLTKNMEIREGSDPSFTLTVPLGEDHTITRGEGFSGNFFTIKGACGLTIQDNGTGVLTLDGMNVSTASGRLIYLENYNSHGASFTMDGGILTNNTNPSMMAGAAVFMSKDCTFTMNKGTITGNHATNSMGMGMGGGVCVGTGSNFVMTGGVISKNTANTGAGVYVMPKDWPEDSVAGAFTMSGGQITENTATNYDGNGANGGGVTIDGTCTISGDAKITKNSAGNQGGGVYLGNDNALFTMNGGEIAENTADQFGGGVYIAGGAVVMRGGTITKNQIVEDWGSGSGVADYGTTSPSFTMTGGTISGNGAVGEGEFDHAGTKLTVGGTAVIDTTSTYLSNGGKYIRCITVLSNFTGYVHNITASNTTYGVKLVEFPAGTVDTDFKADQFTLVQSVIDKNKKLIFFPETPPVLRIQKAQDVGIIDGVLGDGSSSGKYAAGEKVTVTASVPHGKKFLRWAATNITLTEEQNTTSPLTFTMPALPVTLTASFEDIPETPTPVPETPTPAQTSPSEGNMDNAFRALFDAQGGTFTQPAAGLSYGDKITRPVSPEKSGAVFAGWYTEAACIHPWNFDDATVKGDLTLYAKWTPATATTSSTAAVTTPVTAPPTQTIVPTVTGTADPVPTTQPSASETKNPEIPAGGGVSPLVIAGGIVIAGALILAALFLLLRRHTVQFLIPTIAGTESYTVRVGHKKSIPYDRLPDFITRQTWYRDELRQIPWDFDEDVVTEQMTLYPGYR